MMRLPVSPGADPKEDPRLDTILAVHAAGSAAIGFFTTLIWGLTKGGTFWPIWVWFGLAVAFGLDLAWWHFRRFRSRRQAALALHMDLTALAIAVLISIWLLSGTGPLWPLIPVLSLVGIAGCHLYLYDAWDRFTRSSRERELTERVGQLERTRQDALEAQTSQLRQVERDLHDGAQSRLVALSMQLGRAEAKLGQGQEATALVRSAREQAGLAIADLRSLVKGIAPPVLIDRGLVEATRSLAGRPGARVTVASAVDRRLPPLVETTAYFVIAESLTNAHKHAPDAPVEVTIAAEAEVLRLEIRDSGPGGADPEGGGLIGLRQRVEALDGRMVIESPAGQGTAIMVELPYRSDT